MWRWEVGIPEEITTRNLKKVINIRKLLFEEEFFLKKFFGEADIGELILDKWPITTFPIFFGISHTHWIQRREAVNSEKSVTMKSPSPLVKLTGNDMTREPYHCWNDKWRMLLQSITYFVDWIAILCEDILFISQPFLYPSTSSAKSDQLCGRQILFCLLHQGMFIGHRKTYQWILLGIILLYHKLS